MSAGGKVQPDFHRKGIHPMRHLPAMLAALAIATPNMAFAATDGTLGQTSNGSFAVSVSVLPDTSNYVQVTNMYDLNLPAIPVTQSTDTVVDNFVCLLRNTPGPIRLSVEQTNGSPSVASGKFSLADPVTKAYTPISMTLGRPGVPTVNLENGLGVNTTSSNPGCTGNAAGSNSNGFRLRITIPAPSGDPTKVGDLTGTFTLFLSPL